jgi:hypothetical protein
MTAAPHARLSLKATHGEGRKSFPMFVLEFQFQLVIPANAGIHGNPCAIWWIPAFAGMTAVKG